MPKIRSYVDENGQAYYRNTGRYKEVTKSAVGAFKNGARSAMSQKNLAPAGDHSAAARAYSKVRRELSR